MMSFCYAVVVQTWEKKSYDHFKPKTWSLLDLECNEKTQKFHRGERRKEEKMDKLTMGDIFDKWHRKV